VVEELSAAGLVVVTAASLVLDAPAVVVVDVIEVGNGMLGVVCGCGAISEFSGRCSRTLLSPNADKISSLKSYEVPKAVPALMGPEEQHIHWPPPSAEKAWRVGHPHKG
jgi:hypothetical protein